MSDKPYIEACPWCGCNRCVVDYDNAKVAYVKCPGCGATGPGHEDDPDAINDWNRVDVAAHREAQP